jgi:hypothetical protein
MRAAAEARRAELIISQRKYTSVRTQISAKSTPDDVTSFANR